MVLRFLERRRKHLSLDRLDRKDIYFLSMSAREDECGIGFFGRKLWKIWQVKKQLNVKLFLSQLRRTFERKEVTDEISTGEAAVFFYSSFHKINKCPAKWRELLIFVNTRKVSQYLLLKQGNKVTTMKSK